MSENKRTYEYSEELTTITGDELLHADLAGYTYAKRTKLSTVFNWIKTSLTGFFIRSINGTYPDANSNIAITYSDVGAGSAQAVADNTANILVLDEDLEDLSQDVVINTALSIDNEDRISVNETKLLGKKDRTGFNNQDDVTVTYDEATKQITLTNVTGACYKGEVVPELVNGWVSSALPSASPTGGWFLYYNDTGFVFSQVLWSFEDIQIAYVFYDVNGSFITATREPHGEEQSIDSHEEFHNLFGTYVKAVPTLTGVILDSTTEADRRPLIPQTILQDEDLATINEALLTNNYTLMTLTGTGDSTFLKDQTDIFTSANAQSAYWNEFNGTTWIQSQFTNNQYGSIWVFAVPCSADTNSQKARFVFVQGQAIFSSSASAIDNIKGLSFTSLNLGDWGDASPEYNCIAHIVIKETGAGLWAVDEIIKQYVTRAGQGVQSGNFLSAVSSDSTYFDGAGTADDELTFNETTATKVDNLPSDTSGELDLKSDKIAPTNVLAFDDLTKIHTDDNSFGYFSTLYGTIRTKLDSIFATKEPNLSLVKTNSNGELGQADKQIIKLDGFSSYTDFVVPLVSLDNTNINLESYSYGSFEAHRSNGSSDIKFNGTLGLQKIYNTETVSANLVINTNVYRFVFDIKICTFTYNGVKYAGLYGLVNGAQASTLVLDISTNFESLGFVNTYNNNTDTILNSEIYNSLSIEGTDIDETDVHFTLGGVQINKLPSSSMLKSSPLGLIEDGTAEWDAHLADISDGAHSENNYTDSEKATVDGNYNRSVTNQTDITALELNKLDKDFENYPSTSPNNDDENYFAFKSTVSGNSLSVTWGDLKTAISSGLSAIYTSLTTFNAHVNNVADGAHSTNNLTNTLKAIYDGYANGKVDANVISANTVGTSATGQLVRKSYFSETSTAIDFSTFATLTTSLTSLFGSGWTNTGVNHLTGFASSASTNLPAGTSGSFSFDIRRYTGSSYRIEINDSGMFATAVFASGTATTAIEWTDFQTKNGVYTSEYTFPTGDVSLIIPLSNIDVDDGQSLSLKITTPNAGLISSVSWILFTKISDSSAILNLTLSQQVFAIEFTGSNIVISKDSASTIGTIILIERFGGLI